MHLARTTNRCRKVCTELSHVQKRQAYSTHPVWDPQATGDPQPPVATLDYGHCHRTTRGLRVQCNLNGSGPANKDVTPDAMLGYLHCLRPSHTLPDQHLSVPRATVVNYLRPWTSVRLRVLEGLLRAPGHRDTSIHCVPHSDGWPV